MSSQFFISPPIFDLIRLIHGNGKGKVLYTQKDFSRRGERPDQWRSSIPFIARGQVGTHPSPPVRVLNVFVAGIGIYRSEVYIFFGFSQRSPNPSRSFKAWEDIICEIYRH